MPALIIGWIWSNKKMLAEVVACLVIALLIWWFGIHNPNKIKAQQREISALQREVTTAHANINLMSSIEARHVTITKNSYRNISSIRYAPKPGRAGLFMPGGVLQTLP